MIFLKKHTDLLYWIVMVGLVLLFAYSKGWIFANFESINSKQAIVMINNDDNISILDVRTIEEYKAGHLKTGSACRSERIAKYNRLLEIEMELGSSFGGAKSMGFKI